MRIISPLSPQNTHTHIQTHAHTHTNIRTHTHTHTHTPPYKHMHTHTNTHTHMQPVMASSVTDLHSHEQHQPWCLRSDTAELWEDVDNQQPVV